MFRGLDTGIPMDSVRSHEKASLFLQDACGLVYHDTLSQDITAEYEYYNQCPPGEDSLAHRLQGIVATLRIRDEMQAADIIARMEEKLRARLGVAEGGFGDWNWESNSMQTGASLKLQDGKKEILLNLYRL